jgi:hypothetical protein
VRKDVSIAIPIAQIVEPKAFQSMMALVNCASRNGVDIRDIGITERVMIDDARNMLAESFLKGSVEWIFWMDSDMVFPEDTLVKLFKVAEEKQAKMVSGIYYQRKGMNYPVLWSRGEDLESGTQTGLNSPRAKTNKYVGTFVFPHKDKKQPFKAHAAGFGCVLVHRSILEIMPRPWFKFIKNECSEDFYFFVNARELGFDLWVEPTIDLGHIGDAPVITKADFHKNATAANIEIDTIKTVSV